MVRRRSFAWGRPAAGVGRGMSGLSMSEDELPMGFHMHHRPQYVPHLVGQSPSRSRQHSGIPTLRFSLREYWFHRLGCCEWVLEDRSRPISLLLLAARIGGLMPRIPRPVSGNERLVRMRRHPSESAEATRASATGRIPAAQRRGAPWLTRQCSRRQVRRRKEPSAIQTSPARTTAPTHS